MGGSVYGLGFSASPIPGPQIATLSSSIGRVGLVVQNFTSGIRHEFLNVLFGDRMDLYWGFASQLFEKGTNFFPVPFDQVEAKGAFLMVVAIVH